MTSRAALSLGLALLVIVGVVVFLYLSTHHDLSHVVGGPG